MILITNATPHVPGRDTKSIAEAAGVLKDKQIDQLRTVVSRAHQDKFYAPELQKGATRRAASGTT